MVIQAHKGMEGPADFLGLSNSLSFAMCISEAELIIPATMSLLTAHCNRTSPHHSNHHMYKLMKVTTTWLWHLYCQKCCCLYKTECPTRRAFKLTWISDAIASVIIISNVLYHHFCRFCWEIRGGGQKEHCLAKWRAVTVRLREPVQRRPHFLLCFCSVCVISSEVEATASKISVSQLKSEKWSFQKRLVYQKAKTNQELQDVRSVTSTTTLKLNTFKEASKED